MGWEEIVIGGVSLSALIVGIVNLLKRAGLPDNKAPYAAGIVALIGYLVVYWLLPAYPAIEPALKVITGAVVAFLGASGIHQFGKTSKPD